MLLKEFTKSDNIGMLWDVISDEDIFTFLAPDIQQKIYQIFINNIQGFFESEKNKINSLVDLNKKYILVILNHIKKTYPYQPNKIKIHNEPINKQTITYEEIHNERRSQFDKDYNRRQEEFQESMTLKAPPVPEFADKQTDRPIKEIDKILKEMQSQRNYEVEQINRTYNNSNQVDNWLTPQETSLKNEKIGGIEQIQNSNRFKNLDEFENTNSQMSPKKNVSFSNSNEVNFFTEDDEDNDIFSKLKKVDNQNQNQNNENHIKFEVLENANEDRIAKLERNIGYLNEKIDKIINLLSNKS